MFLRQVTYRRWAARWQPYKRIHYKSLRISAIVTSIVFVRPGKTRQKKSKTYARL